MTFVTARFLVERMDDEFCVMQYTWDAEMDCWYGEDVSHGTEIECQAWVDRCYPGKFVKWMVHFEVLPYTAPPPKGVFFSRLRLRSP